MMNVRARSAAALLLIVSLAACKKEGGAEPAEGAELPAEMKPHPAHGDPSKLVVPPLMANVPADTPYLLAGLDAMPPEFYAAMKQAFGPLVDAVAGKWQKQRSENKVFDAVLAELDGKWNQAGLASLGVSDQPRFAIYGLGLSPVVARVAVKDHRLLQATIERIAAKAGAALPAMATKDGRSYWQHANDDGTSFVIALADNQLIFAIGKASDVDSKLGLILGSDKPARSMADGAQVKQLMARHGFGGQLIGFADTRRIASRAIEAAGASPSPACTGEIDRIGAKLPRIVLGYGELSAARISGALVFELAPDVVAQLRGLKVEIPGLAAALSGQPLFAMAGGMNLAKAQQVGVAIAGGLKQLGAACSLAPLAVGSERMADALSQPLPPPVGQISGGAIVLDDFAFTAGGEPKLDQVAGVVAIASPDARALFQKAAEQVPPLKSLGIAVDGKLHPLTGPMPLPFPVFGGVGDRLITLTAGPQRRASAEALLAVHRGGQAPLFAMSYDVGRFLQLALQSNRQLAESVDPGVQAVLTSLAKLFGRVSGTLDVTDQGLALWSTTQLK